MHDSSGDKVGLCAVVLWSALFILVPRQASASADVRDASQCPQDVTIAQLRDLAAGGGLTHKGHQLKAASTKNIQDILPSSWSPTSYTALAHLRKSSEKNGVLECEYGFKSTVGATMAKVQFWQTKENLDTALDYRFSLYYDPHEGAESSAAALSPSHEPKAADSAMIHPKAVITQEDIQNDATLKDLLMTLDLVNNPRISWTIVNIQYNLLTRWKTGAELEKIHQAFEKLGPYFTH